MEREFFYLFCLKAQPGVYRFGITADVQQELEEGGMGLHPGFRHRPRRGREVELIASCWVGGSAEKVRARIMTLLGRPARWGNAQLALSAEQLLVVQTEMLAAGKAAVRVPAGWIRPGWDWGEDALNAGLTDAVVVNFSRQPVR